MAASIINTTRNGPKIAFFFTVVLLWLHLSNLRLSGERPAHYIHMGGYDTAESQQYYKPIMASSLLPSVTVIKCWLADRCRHAATHRGYGPKQNKKPPVD
ncbi:hypothetical protein KW538_05055 [Vibrio fluvialis]|nr:hypothetical protein [Vibrio fluvialis]